MFNVVLASKQDFATNLLRSTNALQRDLQAHNDNYGRNWLNIDHAQADQLHRAMHHRSHQPEF